MASGSGLPKGSPAVPAPIPGTVAALIWRYAGISGPPCAPAAVLARARRRPGLGARRPEAACESRQRPLPVVLTVVAPAVVLTATASSPDAVPTGRRAVPYGATGSVAVPTRRPARLPIGQGRARVALRAGAFCGETDEQEARLLASTCDPARRVHAATSSWAVATTAVKSPPSAPARVPLPVAAHGRDAAAVLPRSATPSPVEIRCAQRKTCAPPTAIARRVRSGPRYVAVTTLLTARAATATTSTCARVAQLLVEPKALRATLLVTD